MKILIASVGGSDAPIVKSIQSNKPDRVYFICSESTETTKGSWETIEKRTSFLAYTCKECGHKEQRENKSLVEQTGLLPDQYEIVKVDPDKPYEIYTRVTLLISQLLSESHQVIVDYTGGTKSMSVGCAAAAMDYPNCELAFVGGPRVDLIKIKHGMHSLKKFKGNTAFVHRQLRLVRELVSNWNYIGAIPILEALIEEGLTDDNNVERLLILCKAYAAWDKFNYQEAAEFLSPYTKDSHIAEAMGRVKRIIIGLNWYKSWNPDTRPNMKFDVVYDLFLNAERRANQGNYDDAIARIYRAIEMYGQFCLMNSKPSLYSSDIDVNRLPENLREEYEAKRRDGKIQIGLVDNFELLAKLNHPAGKVWLENRSKMLDKLKKRNYSFLAHGVNPLQASDFAGVREQVWNFINQCDQACGISKGLADYTQLPQSL